MAPFRIAGPTGRPSSVIIRKWYGEIRSPLDVPWSVTVEWTTWYAGIHRPEMYTGRTLIKIISSCHISLCR